MKNRTKYSWYYQYFAQHKCYFSLILREQVSFLINTISVVYYESLKIAVCKYYNLLLVKGPTIARKGLILKSLANQE